MVLIVSGTAGVVAGCAVYGKKMHHRNAGILKFRELQMQHSGKLSSDDDEANRALVRDDDPHL